MSRFKYLVDSPTGMEGFTAKYHIPQGVGLQYCPPDQILTNREEGEVVIPMIVFIEGGMTLPIGGIIRDYLLNHRLCPHQCAPNLFRVLGSIDALNNQMNLGLTWHDIVLIYLTTISSSDVFVDKYHVTPRLSFVNRPSLNKLLRAEIFISEDRQLRAAHLILDYEPLSRIF